MTSDLSRRELLAAASIGGGFGLLVGTGTAARLSDRESLLDNLLAAGELDLEVIVNGDGGETAHSEGTARITFDLTDERTSGTATLSIQLPGLDGANNPAYGWLRTSCPDESPLAEALQVTLRYDCAASDEVLAAGSLVEVANALRNGVPLSPVCDADVTAGEQGCLQPDEAVDLALEWTLDDDYTGRDDVSLAIEAAGRQCRRQDGTTNPFTPPVRQACVEHYAISYVEIYRCLSDGSTEFVGNLELDGDYCGQAGIGENSIEVGRYDLYNDGDDCSDAGYDVRVTDTVQRETNGGSETTGIAFELLDDGSEQGPDLCKVVVGGGPDPDGTGPAEAVYDSPSDFDGNATDGVLYAPEQDGGDS